MRPLTINGFLVIFMLQCGTLWANDFGMEFITAFMQNTNSTEDTNSLQLIITAYTDQTSITINLTNTQIQWTTILMQGQTWSAPMPPSAEMVGTNRFQSCILISSNKPISVVSVNWKSQSAGTAALLPISQLGKHYFVVTPTGKPKCLYKEFSVVNSKLRNKVIINFKCHVTFTGETYSPKKKLTIVLEPYQALQLQSEDDMSGTSVSSDHPVAVLSGHSCVWQNGMCDHVYEQLRPVSAWTRNYLVPSLVRSTNIDIAYVVASIKNTQLLYTSGRVRRKARLGCGEVYEINVKPSTPVSISANFPVQVIYYYVGGMFQPQQVGSYIISLSGSDSFCRSYMVYGLDGFQNSAVIIAKTSACGGITLDSQPLTNIQWNRIPATQYSWGMFNFNSKVNSHLVSHPDTAFGLLNIGSNVQSAYGSSAICTQEGSTAICQNAPCTAEETCRLVNNNAVCVQNWDTVCTIWGDPHYITFDGYTYDFQGTCSYTIVKNCGVDSSVPVFNIEARNENRGSSQVSYVATITIQVHGYTITIAGSEYGFVRVNNVRGPLPISLQGGVVQIDHSGQYARMETIFGLQVLYDWKTVLIVRIPKAFQRNVCGMCGNYNQNPNDDFRMPTGKVAGDATQFGMSWKTQDSDGSCMDDCNGVCQLCPPDLSGKYSTLDFCGILADNTGPFRLCNVQVNPSPYMSSCVFDMCMNIGYWNILCQALTTYAIACQNRGFQILEWRGSFGCAPDCPPNSVYKICGSACPETCDPASASTPCKKMCVETCECNEGFVLSGGLCIPRSRCGCVFEGRLYSPNSKFWMTNCLGQCFCNPLSREVECKKSQCRNQEICDIRDGIIDCYPVSYSTCTASGDPHYNTFDGLRYNFMGTCVYLLSGLARLYTGLVDFQVFVQNEQRSSNAVAYTKLVEITMYGTDIVISREYPQKIKLNGLLINLPYNVGNGKILMYNSGIMAVIKTDFGLKLTFDWWSNLKLTIPSTYSKSVSGLCGNLDSDPKNDLIIGGDSVPSSANDFGNSWKMRDIPGCGLPLSSNCSNLAAMVMQQRKNGNGCGVLVDKSRSFRDCQNIVDPEGYFQDCVYDFCFYQGRQDIFCQMITAYSTACLEAGATVYSWRTANFCPMNCAQNSKYDICARGCGMTCSDLLTPFGCDTNCREDCVCNDGFLHSNGECVPASQCGCIYSGFYYKAGEIFYPSGTCNQQCICKNSGGVECSDYSCGPNEACKVVNGIKKCQPIGSATCSASGDPHYRTFDKVSYDFQGSCSYTLATTCFNSSNLEPFTVTVENENWGNQKVSVTKVVTVTVYGYTITLSQNSAWIIQVNGASCNLPFNLPGGILRVYQNGMNIVVKVDFGLEVMYDLVYHTTVTVPGNYKRQMCGLCGNYNGNKRDDFLLPDGTLAPDATTFGFAWRIELPGTTCKIGCGGPGNDCPACDSNCKEMFKQSNLCGILIAPNGPFTACYPVVNPSTYFSNCVFDLCQGGGDNSILCYNIQSYVADCLVAGVTISPWRTSFFCPINCPINSHYSLCTDTCSTSCAQLTDPAMCPPGCAEGCQCDDGFFSNGQDCVSLSNCGCFYSGIYFKPKEKFLLDGCQAMCSCSPSTGVSCVPYTCSDSETCEVMNGARSCVDLDPCRSSNCRPQETCQIINGNPQCAPKYSGSCWGWGDQHYRTFDGYSFDLQGTCGYTIAQYCGNDRTLVPFTIVDKTDNRGNPSLSYNQQVTMYVYGYNISIVQGENGKIRLNGILTSLPVFLGGGKVSAFQTGVSATVNTDFNLNMAYDWTSNVFISLSSSYHGQVCGICGNFNNDPSDDMMLSNGNLTTSLSVWAGSWKVSDSSASCWNACPDPNNCNSNDGNNGPYGGPQFCGIITQTGGPFRDCWTTVTPDSFYRSCIYDVKMNGGAIQFLCKALEVYAATCRKMGASVYDWRTTARCPLSCPDNSHYVICGNACPPSCANRNGPVGCTLPCIETCICNTGFLLSGSTCVPASSCGCTYNGLYYQPKDAFWTDNTCQVRCTCDPVLGLVTCQKSNCKATETCMVVNGILGCYPISYSTCSASGDPHYTTFDGMRYNFMGTCIYQLVGLCSADPTLTPFTIKVQNNNRGNKAVSYTKMLTLTVYGVTITLSRDAPKKIMVNGVFVALPYYFPANQIVAFISGWNCVIKTDFSLTLTFDWNSLVKVTLPGTYAGAVCGLCGNYNQKRDDDMSLPNGTQTTVALAFGNGWKVEDVPGCSAGCTSGCRLCTDQELNTYRARKDCGILQDFRGPFSQCLSKIIPTPYFTDCVFDGCQYKGYQVAICDSISSYVAACQAQEITINDWRSPEFCNVSCPQNSHYELCGTGCPVTCSSFSSPTGCDAPCTESCVCNSGFVLSGDVCVPIAECGCIFQFTYYLQGQNFYLNDSCQLQCICEQNGQVNCQSASCGANEVCKVVNGVRGCFPTGVGQCVAAGDPHYCSFDGWTFDFQGTCTYILAKYQSNLPQFANFLVAVKNEVYGSGRVSVARTVMISVDIYNITLDRGVHWRVTVNDLQYVLPAKLTPWDIHITQQGNNIVLLTSFGLRVLYDSMYYVLVEVPSTLKGQMLGLCGNFNDNPNDDFQLPNGVRASYADDFGSAWQLDASEVNCTGGCGNNCPACSAINTKLYSRPTSCGMISDPKGPFGACIGQVKPRDYVKFCLYDLCSVSDPTDLLCKNLQAYTVACQAVGASVKPWRTALFCPMACPCNSHYETCTSTCDSTCASVTESFQCSGQCFEGCACDAGFLFDGESCVPIQKCGCVYNGQYIPNGGSIISSDCSQQCTCQSGVNGIQCSAHNCTRGSTCNVQNGVYGCYTTYNQCNFPVATIVEVLGNVVSLGMDLSYTCSHTDANFYVVMFNYMTSIEPGGVSVAFVGKTYSIELRSSQEVRVNNILVALPYALPNGPSVNAESNGLLLEHGTFVKVEVTRDGTVNIWTSITLSTCGPCNASPPFTVISSDQVGDSGYALMSWLITPLRHPRTNAERNFNRSHVSTRNTIERAFGLLKSRFRCLHVSGGALLYDPDFCCRIIITCATLHNICVRHNIPLPEPEVPDPSDEDDQQGQQPPDTEDVNPRQRAAGQNIRDTLINNLFTRL